VRVHVVVHESFEGPGAIEEWARTRGHELAFSRLHEGDRLPTIKSIDLLVVMGGPQSTRTTVEECPHFDAATELQLIASCVAAGTAVVGVCLGAQLVGEALGAPAEPSPHPEVGAFPVTLTEEGRKHPFLAGFEPTFLAGHWHGDMPGLTAAAVVLATSAGCPRQIVAYGRHVYGLQLHLELTYSLVEELVKHSQGQLRALDGFPYVSAADLRHTDWRPLHDRLAAFLDRLATDHQGAPA